MKFSILPKKIVIYIYLFIYKIKERFERITIIEGISYSQLPTY